jgi:hypothetical protein
MLGAASWHAEQGPRWLLGTSAGSKSHSTWREVERWEVDVNASAPALMCLDIHLKPRRPDPGTKDVTGVCKSLGAFVEDLATVRL